MTVLSTDPIESVFPGDGTANPLLINWRFLDADDLLVFNGEATLVRGVDYTVTGGGAGGGSIIPSVARAIGQDWRVCRRTTRGQPAAFPSGSYNPKQIEAAIDRQALVAQEQDEALARSPKVPRGEAIGELPNAARRKALLAASTAAVSYFAFDANGNPTVDTPANFALPAMQQADRAAAEANRAGQSADIAIIAGTQHASLAAALAATVNGEYFSYLDAFGLPKFGRNNGGALLAVRPPWLDIAQVSVFPFSAFGGERGVAYGASTEAQRLANGAVNKAAFEALWVLVDALGGGKIVFGEAGDWYFGNCVLPPSTNKIVIEIAKPVTVRPGDPVAGTFMWNFDSTAKETYVSIVGEGVIEANSAVCNGVFVGRSNRARLDVLIRRFVGIGLHVMRPFNALMEVTTYGCGDIANNRPPLLLSGSANEVANDVRIGGTSEQDDGDWVIEAATLIRSIGTLKIHGNGVRKKGLLINRVAQYDIAMEGTFGFMGTGANPAFVRITDSGNSQGQGLYVACSAASTQTRGRLRVNGQNGFNYFGAAGTTGALVQIDCGTNGSSVTVEGAMMPVVPTAGGDWAAIQLIGGNQGARHDLSGFRIRSATQSDIDRLILDQRSGGVRHTCLPQAGPIAIPPEKTLKATGAGTRTYGETGPFSAAGSATNPARAGLVTTPATSARGARLVMPLRVFEANHPGPVAATTVIMAPRPPLIAEDATGGASANEIGEVDFSAMGVPATYDAANHWELDVYRSGLVKTFIIRRDALTAAIDDKLPNVVSGSDSIGHLFRFWNFTVTTAFKTDYIAMSLRAVGAPPPLTAITAAVTARNVI